jgi:3-oxoacyl-[acyl-carrier-protein] synthase-3
MKEVELISTGIYLPGEPVPFEKIEEVIGYLDDAPERVKKMIGKLRPMVKGIIGIEQCHFAVDPKTKNITESVTSMAVKAIKTALKKAQMKASEIDCILLATPLPDYLTPPTTTLVQEELGIEKCAEIEVHSNCTGATKVFQIAFDALRVGRYKNVVIVYSQLSSTYLISSYYNQEKVKTENTLLRWFLSDSASAVILSARDKLSSGIKVIDVYNESVGGKFKPAMWAKFGARELRMPKVYQEGLHHLGQDYSIVVEIGERFLADGFKRMLERSQISANEIDHVSASIPSTKLLEKGKNIFLKEFSIPIEKWFSNIHRKGYSGGSSVIIGLDEMLDRKLFKINEILTGITIESSKWMFGGFTLKNLGG